MTTAFMDITLTMMWQIAPEQAIAETLSVPRTPVREAVRRLDQEGLLATSSSRRVRARELSAAEAVARNEVRALLDGRAARCAVQRASKDDVSGLRALLDLEIVTRGTIASVIPGHRHAAIVKAIEAGDPEAAEAAMRTNSDTDQGVAKERMEQPNGESR